MKDISTVKVCTGIFSRSRIILQNFTACLLKKDYCYDPCATVSKSFTFISQNFSSFSPIHPQRLVSIRKRRRELLQTLKSTIVWQITENMFEPRRINQWSCRLKRPGDSDIKMDTTLISGQRLLKDWLKIRYMKNVHFTFFILIIYPTLFFHMSLICLSLRNTVVIFRVTVLTRHCDIACCFGGCLFIWDESTTKKWSKKSGPS